MAIIFPVLMLIPEKPLAPPVVLTLFVIGIDFLSCLPEYPIITTSSETVTSYFKSLIFSFWI